MTQTLEEKQRTSSIIVVFCFIRRNGELLLVDRAFPPYQGVRTIPGGHKKRGEELLAACLREMKEETGLTLHDCRFAGQMQVHRDNRPGPEYLCLYYAAEEFSGEATPSDEGNLTWTRIADIHADTGTHPALRALLPFIESGTCPFTAEAYVDADGRGEYTVTGPGKGAQSVTKRYE